VLSFLFFLLSWLLSPGYLEKKADGEFLLLLTRFDPKALCPFCEVVQNPLSKHCFACGKCVEEFHHHCYWTNNCVGGKNQWVFVAFLFTLAAFLLSTLTLVVSSNFYY